VRALRAELRKWIQIARERDVVITDRGRPVARLVPVDRHPGLEQLAAEGLLTLPGDQAMPSGAWKRVRARGSVSELVAEQRR
jgi:prevent-host-death family protein